MPRALHRHGVLAHWPANGQGVTAPYEPPAPVPPSVGTFADARRYAPQGTLPTGVVYNAATGWCERPAPSWETIPGEGARGIDPTAYQHVVSLTAVPDVNTNATALQDAVDAALGRSDHTVIYLGPAGSVWGDAHTLTFKLRQAAGRIVLCDYRLRGDYTGPFPYPRDLSARLQRADVSMMPKFYTRGGLEAIQFAPGTRNVSLVGLEVTYHPDFDPGAHTNGSYAQNNGFLAACLNYGGLAATDFPDRVLLRHLGVHGKPLKASRRGMRLNTQRLVVTKCAVWDIGVNSPDCQAFNALAGPGSYVLEDNDLEAAWGETVMFGGGGSNGQDATCVVQDVALLANTLSVSPTWYADGAETKNLLEFKIGIRALVERNLFTGYRGRGLFQSQFFAVVVKLAVDTPSEAAFSRTRDITIRCNRLRDCASLFSFSGADHFTSGNGTVDVLGGVHDVEVCHNICELPREDFGRNFELQTTTIDNFAFHHNTILDVHTRGFDYTHMVESVDDGPRTNFSLYGNVFVMQDPTAHPEYWLRSGNGGNRVWLANMQATGALRGTTRIGGNVIVHPNADQTTMLDGDTAVRDLSTLGLSATGDVAPDSRLLTSDLDGARSGADARLVPA